MEFEELKRVRTTQGPQWWPENWRYISHQLTKQATYVTLAPFNKTYLSIQFYL